MFPLLCNSEEDVVTMKGVNIPTDRHYFPQSLEEEFKTEIKLKKDASLLHRINSANSKGLK